MSMKSCEASSLSVSRTFSLVCGSFFMHGGNRLMVVVVVVEVVLMVMVTATTGGSSGGSGLRSFQCTHREGLARWLDHRVLRPSGGPLDRPAHVRPHELQAILCAQFANSFSE